MLWLTGTRRLPTSPVLVMLNAAQPDCSRMLAKVNLISQMVMTLLLAKFFELGV